MAALLGAVTACSAGDDTATQTQSVSAAASAAPEVPERVISGLPQDSIGLDSAAVRDTVLQAVADIDAEFDAVAGDDQRLTTTVNNQRIVGPRAWIQPHAGAHRGTLTHGRLLARTYSEGPYASLGLMQGWNYWVAVQFGQTWKSLIVSSQGIRIMPFFSRAHPGYTFAQAMAHFLPSDGNECANAACPLGCCCVCTSSCPLPLATQ